MIEIKFKLHYIGFFVLSAIVMILYGLSAYQSFGYSIIPGIILGIAAVSILYKIFYEYKFNTKGLEGEKLFTAENLKLMAAVFLGAMITYFISIDLELGPVVASGLVGVLAVLIFPKYSVAAFCGSFAGMSSCCLLTYPLLILSALAAGMVFVCSKNVFNGFGGKLGTIAFTGCTVIALTWGTPFLTSAVPDFTTGILTVVFSIFGAVITYILSIRFKHGPVMASGIVGVLAGLILPAVFTEYGSYLAVMVFCASFIGMASPKQIKNEIFVAASAIIAAVIFMFSVTWGGAGGKLGTIAFGSVLAVAGLMDLYYRIFKKDIKVSR